jgi:predicted outer membrane repeat protein
MTIDGAGAGISLYRNEMFGAFRLMETGLDTDVAILGLEFNLGEAPAGEKGGAIRAYGNLWLDSTIFYNNTAQMGGAVYSSSVSILTINASQFWYNTADSGGAVAAFGEVDVSGSYLSSNTANSFGGAIYIYGNATNRKNSSIVDSTLTDNYAEDSGGGIYASEVDLVLSGGTRIQFNIADGPFGGGGGVYISGTGGSITYDGVTIEANSAASGDGVYREASVLRIDGPGSVTFVDNSEHVVQ